MVQLINLTHGNFKMDTIFFKENLMRKPKGCFPTFMDGIPSEPIDVYLCASPKGIWTKNLLVSNYQNSQQHWRQLVELTLYATMNIIIYIFPIINLDKVYFDH